MEYFPRTYFFGDLPETSEVQAERIRRQSVSGDRHVALEGHWLQITVDRVLRARGKMMKNQAHGSADCLVTEMLQCACRRSPSLKRGFVDSVQVPS